jgi:hypothetical protein
MGLDRRDKEGRGEIHRQAGVRWTAFANDYGESITKRERLDTPLPRKRCRRGC